MKFLRQASLILVMPVMFLIEVVIVILRCVVYLLEWIADRLDEV